MYWRSKFLEISKTIHFWNLQSMGNPKINVGICVITCMTAILDFLNGRHKIHNFAISAASQPKNVIQYANPMFSGSRKPLVASLHF